MNKKWPANEIIMKKTSELVPYARNSRTHSPEQIKQIENDLRRYGVTNFRFCIENDCYIVTENGEVFRVCLRRQTRSGNLYELYEIKFLYGSIDKYGYRTYRMTVNGIKKHVKGHRVVLNAFIGKEPHLVANHKDGIKTNNKLNNLEWATVAENNKHAIKTGLWSAEMCNGNNSKIPHYCYISIYIDHYMNGRRRAEIAAQYGVVRQTIDNIINKTKANLCNLKGDKYGC